MGYSATVTFEAQGDAWIVTLRADLSRGETSQLFLSGDSKVSWPVEGLKKETNVGLERSAMFVSEIAARPEGLTIRYCEKGQAGRAVALLRMQLNQIGIQEVT